MHPWWLLWAADDLSKLQPFGVNVPSFPGTAFGGGGGKGGPPPPPRPEGLGGRIWVIKDSSQSLSD